MALFSEIVDAADQLSVDEQETLLEILRHRLAERNRKRIVSEVAEARAEFTAGRTRAVSVEEIMDEARGEP